MWAAMAGTPNEKAEDSKPNEKAADLNESLLKCVGEQEHKILRQNCAKIMKKEMDIEAFHLYSVKLFQNKEDGMKLYRRLALSFPFPDGDKRQMLLSLVDEAVAVAKKTPTASVEVETSTDETEPKPATEIVVTTEVSPPTEDKGAEDKVDKAEDGVSGGGGIGCFGGGEEGVAVEDETASAEKVNTLISEKKQAVSSKEKAILSVMARRQEDLAKEKRALDMIRSEMAALSRQQSNEITELMESLGETDRDLWYLERDFKAAEAEYLKCKGRYDKMKNAKTQMVNSLTSLTLNAERRKEEKLNSIMEKLKKDGVVFPGAALEGLADQ